MAILSRTARKIADRTASNVEPGLPAGEERAGVGVGDGPGSRARLFDADRSDRELSLSEAIEQRPGKRQLLWIDLCGDASADDGAKVIRAFDLAPSMGRALEREESRPELSIHGDRLELQVAAEPPGDGSSAVHWLDVVAGPNLVITRHRTPLSYLDDLDRRIERDTSAGLLDSATFLAALLDETVTTYFSAVDAIEDEIDALDARALRGDRHHDHLGELIALRRRIARLRRLLVAHRSVFAGLTTADTLRAGSAGEESAAFASVASRFSEAITAVENTRDVLIGSFDVLMTRTAQRTNDVMKVLTLATVVLLPGSLIAGVLGMNVDVPLDKNDPVVFWMVVGGIALLGLAMLATARLRAWL